MTDIVDKLKKNMWLAISHPHLRAVCDAGWEAANEIERLRAERDAWENAAQWNYSKLYEAKRLLRDWSVMRDWPENSIVRETRVFLADASCTEVVMRNKLTPESESE